MSSTNSPSHSGVDTSGTEERHPALEKSIDYYASKSRSVHAAILEVWDGTPFLEVAKKYNQNPDVLASAFAVFGKQAIDIAREKGVYYETAYLAMGFNKDGYDDSNEMNIVLPRAIGIKRDEGIAKRIADEKADLRKDPRKEERASGADGEAKRARVGGGNVITVSYELYGGTGRSAPVRPRGGV